MLSYKIPDYTLYYFIILKYFIKDDIVIVKLDHLYYKIY